MSNVMKEALTRARSGSRIREILSDIDMPNSMILAAIHHDSMADFWNAMTDALHMIHLMGSLGIGTAEQRVEIATAMIRETRPTANPGELVCETLPGLQAYFGPGRDPDIETPVENYTLNQYDMMKADAADTPPRRTPGTMAAICYGMMALAEGRSDHRAIFESRGIPKIPAHADIIRRILPNPFTA